MIGRLNAPILNIYRNPDRNETWIKLRTALSGAGKNFYVVEPLPPAQATTRLDVTLYNWDQVSAFLLKHLAPVPEKS
jgi:hypothetical protein